MKISTALAVLAAVVIIGGGAWWYLSQNASMPQSAAVGSNTGTDNTAPSDQTTSSTGVGVTGEFGVGVPKTVTINYTSTGFEPSALTINVGDTVKFVSTDGSPMWVASDPHPTHTGYDGTSRSQHCASGYAGPAPLDECNSNSTFSFTFNKAGTFGFHNHLADDFAGTITVK